MPKPKAYAPQQGYQFQLLTRYQGEWEHCDYAENWAELKPLLRDLKIAHGPGFQFRVIVLPQKYWKKK